MPGIVLSLDKTAEVFGVNRRTLSEWVSAGCPARKVGQAWKLDSAAVSTWLRERQEKRPGNGAGSEVEELDLRERKAKTTLAELKTQRELNLVLDRAEVRSAFQAIGHIFSSAREALPSQWAVLLVGKSDLTEIEQILRRELRASDSRVADEIQTRFGNMVGDAGEGSVPDGDGTISRS